MVRTLHGPWHTLYTQCRVLHAFFSLPDDFESSPVLSKKAKTTEVRGQKEAVNSLANRAKTLKQEPENDLSGPPKKARQSRDERQFNKATEQALKDSMRAVAHTDHQESPIHTPSRQGLEEGTIQALNHSYVTLYPILVAGKDGDYHPIDQEEGDDYSSGYDGTSDSDFEVAAPPAPNKSKPAKTKSVAAQEPKNTTTKLSRTETDNGGKGNLKPPPKTVVETVSRTRQKAAITLSPSLSSKISRVLSPKSPLPGFHGTPGLGKRRLPNWTPPGQTMTPYCDLDDLLCFRSSWWGEQDNGKWGNSYD